MRTAAIFALVAAGSAAAFAPGAAAPRVLQSTSRSAAMAMAGFGAAKGGGKAGFGAKGKAKVAKKEQVSPRRQWSAYTKLTEGGVQPVCVYARDGATEGDEWLLVGNVAIEAKEGSAEQAAQYQKRLILEHAARLSPRLKVAQASLDCGIESDGTVSKLVKPAEMPETLACGFLGEPDAGGFYSRGNRNEKEMAARGAAPKADSKGRIGGSG